MKNISDLDLLEKNVLKAISESSVFTITEVLDVYLKVGSFDKTIDILKLSVDSKKNHTDFLNMILKVKETNIPCIMSITKFKNQL